MDFSYTRLFIGAIVGEEILFFLVIHRNLPITTTKIHLTKKDYNIKNDVSEKKDIKEKEEEIKFFD